jgi:hypothetical protein
MARYDYGVERRVYVNNLSEREIDAVVADLIQQSKQINAAINTSF